MSENEQPLPNEACSVKRNVLDYLFFTLCGFGITGYYICLILYEYASFEVPRRISLYYCADVLSWIAIVTATIGIIIVIIKRSLNNTANGNCDEKVHRAYNRNETINRMLTFTIPAYILALVLAINSYATKPMYIAFIIGGCLSVIVLYSLILRLVYNKRFKTIGIKTALPFITLLFFLIANIASITMFMLDIKGFSFKNLKLYNNAGITSFFSTIGFIVCSIISFVKLLKNPRKGNIDPKQLIKPFIILVIAVMSLVVFLIPFGNVTPNAITHFGLYTEDDVSIPPDIKGDFVSIEFTGTHTTISASFFSLVSLKTGKTYQAIGYKNMITGGICLDTNRVLAIYTKFRYDNQGFPMQIFFIVDEPISNDFVLVYSSEGFVVEEYLIPAKAIQ